MVLPLAVLLLLRIVLAILFVCECVCFHMKLKVFPFEICEELCLNFDGGCLDSVDFFWYGGHFTMSILSIHKRGRSFHLLVSSLVFLQRLEVFVIQAFHLLG